jgi:hypothetical protein
MKNEEIKFGYYLVVFLDLLNQKEVLASMDSLPSNENEKEIFTEKLKTTYGKVKAFRSLFDNFYAGYSQSHAKRPTNGVSEFIPQLKQFRGWTAKKHYFSDTVVYYSPLGKSDEYFGINNVYSLIAPIASTQLYSLAGETVFRGGIDIGIAGEYFENEIYGNALYNAHHLEDEVAQYPRVVVGKNLYKYLDNYINLQGDDIFSEYHRSFSKLCLDFIKIDYDGEYIINPTCNRVRQMAGNNNNDIHSKALLFAMNEMVRFKNADKQILYERYQKLINLLRS